MIVVRFVLLIALLVGSGRGALADGQSACIAACETPAISCSETHRDQKSACVRGVRESCRSKPPSELMACVRAAGKTCGDTHNPTIAACDSTFQACHKACSGDGPITHGYWCRTEVDLVDLTDKVARKTGYCELEQSQKSLDTCLQRFALPGAMGGSVVTECTPL